jgi:NhaA family Na+:H+ antiporter
MSDVIEDFQDMDKPNTPILANEQQHALAMQAEDIAKSNTIPILRWGSALDKPVTLIILPLFAFLNAGVLLPTEIPNFNDTIVTLAIMCGLVLGKGIGISLFAWVSLKIGLVRLPPDIHFYHIVGIGFTMSLFISAVAFAGQPALIEQAKLGILFGSIIAGVLGFIIFSLPSKT